MGRRAEVLASVGNRYWKRNAELTGGSDTGFEALPNKYRYPRYCDRGGGYVYRYPVYTWVGVLVGGSLAPGVYLCRSTQLTEGVSDADIGVRTE